MNAVVTDIKSTKKGRYALFCNEKFLFSVDEETLLRFHIEKGLTLSDSDLNDIRKESDYNKAKERAYSLLAMRSHSERELYEKLCRSFDENTAADTVAKMVELGYINDEDYAEEYIRELLRKDKSKTEIRSKLYQKGVSSDLTDILLDEAEYDETEVVRNLLVKQYSYKLNNESRGKVIAALARRGFPVCTVISEVDRMLEDKEYTDET